MKKFKIRCHALSEIMGGSVGLTEAQHKTFSELSTRKEQAAAGVDKVKPLTANMEAELTDLIYKKENPQLPAGAKTYCEKWLKTALYNRRPEFKNAVIDKGLQCEGDGIKLVAEVYGLTDFEKNEEYFDNEYMEGCPDVIHNKIHDTKLSWDLFTFPMFEDKIPDTGYDWQIKGYQILTGIKEGQVDYCLIDTPMPLVMQDLKKLYYASGGVAEEWTPEKYELLYPNYRFDDIPKEKRVKSFNVEFDPTLEEKIAGRVIMCRAYIDLLMTKFGLKWQG